MVSKISIHGPRVGADSRPLPIAQTSAIFQSTAPVWGPTGHRTIIKPILGISIHGPRVGAD